MIYIYDFHEKMFGCNTYLKKYKGKCFHGFAVIHRYLQNKHPNRQTIHTKIKESLMKIRAHLRDISAQFCITRLMLRCIENGFIL